MWVMRFFAVVVVIIVIFLRFFFKFGQRRSLKSGFAKISSYPTFRWIFLTVKRRTPRRSEIHRTYEIKFSVQQNVDTSC